MNTLDAQLRAAARAAGDDVALVAGERRMTFAELDAAAERLAGGLRASGVEHGDRVVLMAPNGVEAAVTIYATARAGAVVVPLNPTTRPAKLAYVLEHTGAAAMVCDRALADVAREAGAPNVLDDVLAVDGPPGPPPGPDDLAAIIYTSGSTGRPKGVALTHANLVFVVGSIASYLEVTADDRVLSGLPLSFGYGLNQLLTCVHARATLVLERSLAFPGRLVELLERERITGVPGVPTFFSVLTGLDGLAERDLPDLRFLTNAGAALPRPLLDTVRRTFPGARLFSMYGQTECTRVCYLPPDQLDARPGSVGVPIPGTEAWVDETGELLVRGPHVMRGYWNDPAATAERIRPGGVLATGDLFRTDDEGYLYFVARKDDIIKSRGQKVAPREVEEALLAHPGVREAAVVGVADAILGEAVHAHVAAADLSERELRRHCAALLEDHLVPQRFQIHTELPKTVNGKIDRRALAGACRPTAPAP
jgi:amino acid adenylation domain-containing protein